MSIHQCVRPARSLGLQFLDCDLFLSHSVVVKEVLPVWKQRRGLEVVKNDGEGVEGDRRSAEIPRRKPSVIGKFKKAGTVC